jgi:hypothetical protein
MTVASWGSGDVGPDITLASMAGTVTLGRHTAWLSHTAWP